MLSQTRDMKAAKAFFRSAKDIMGYRPERVTTDGHGSCPRAIGSVLEKTIRHRSIGASRDGSNVYGELRMMTRPTGSAANMANFASSFALVAVTTRTFLLPLAALASKEPAPRSTS